METNSDIQKVLKFIEENIRVTDQTEIEYLDPGGHINRLGYKQNQIIFGRRGSGKSLLLKSLKQQNQSIFVGINLEDFKDVSFPNSIIQVQRSIIEQLIPRIKSKYGKSKISYWTKSRKLINKLKQWDKKLKITLRDPDEFDEASTSKQGEKASGKGKAKTPTAEFETNAEISSEEEVSKKITINKLSNLKNEMSEIKGIITEISVFLEQDLFLILDDFYFIRKKDQAHFIDFFHRISKNTPIYLKVATIKHRSHLYIHSGESYVGIEIGHDAQRLSLDYTLDDFNALVSFMKSLLAHINEKVGVDIKYEQLITENAFRFLCLASGGVPRDFFSLFISLGNNMESGISITKPNVIETAIENLSTKMEALKKDASDEEFILEHYLNYIRNNIITDKKWNSFLVSNPEIQNYPQIDQALKELVDLRFLHIVDLNISAAHSDGTRYSAYMVDIGLFPNANPRRFQQVEPGQKDEHQRQDKIRSAPKLNLVNFDEVITAQLKREDKKLSISKK